MMGTTELNLDSLLGAPLGPGSLSWLYLGDVRNLLCVNRTGMLQVMHPAISAGLSEIGRAHV